MCCCPWAAWPRLHPTPHRRTGRPVWARERGQGRSRLKWGAPSPGVPASQDPRANMTIGAASPPQGDTRGSGIPFVSPRPQPPASTPPLPGVRAKPWGREASPLDLKHQSSLQAPEGVRSGPHRAGRFLKSAPGDPRGRGGAAPGREKQQQVEEAAWGKGKQLHLCL